MAGELNGHDVGVAIDGDQDGTFSDLGGVTENSFTLANTPIEIQSKSTSEWRLALASEGLQTVSINVGVIFSNNSTFDVVRALARNKGKADFQIDRNGALMTGTFMVTNYAETSPDNDKLTATFTLESDGTVTGI